ncbi:MAG: murein biosynthesis integral membrane protein MurJ [Desulfobacteraceae bacterium]|nr:murein biosynthesis integral membrane protein MurJ [Desulfobacteraceae bacterium]
MTHPTIRQNSENTRVTKAAGTIGSATLISRIFGYVRDMVFAYFFGTGLISDAFIAAFRIPNLLRRLFGEGSLSIAFIPVFTEYLLRSGKPEAFKLAGAAIRLLSVILVFIVIAGVLASPFIVHLIAPGFGQRPDQLNLTILLTRIMFPYIFFISLVALCMGILNSLGHFAGPAIAPVLLNLAMIGAMFAGWAFTDSQISRVVWLSIGVLVGGVLQLALQFWVVIRYKIEFWRHTSLFHRGLKRVGVLMVPATFGAAVYQINILVGTLLASLLPAGSISFLFYADRLVQFPLGVFGIALATAVLPSLSRQAAAQNYKSMKETFAHGLRLVCFITIPAMIGLIVLREPIVAVLFNRGAFDDSSTRLTATALLYYALGLWAFSAVRIVVSTFYALQDTKTPVRIAVISLVANVILSIILMRPLLHGGLALATTLSSILNLGLLLYMLRRKMGQMGWRAIIASLLKTLLSASAMGVMVYLIVRLIFPDGFHDRLRLMIGLPVCILSGMAGYAFICYLMRSPELKTVMALTRRGSKTP